MTVRLTQQFDMNCDWDPLFSTALVGTFVSSSTDRAAPVSGTRHPGFQWEPRLSLSSRLLFPCLMSRR